MYVISCFLFASHYQIILLWKKILNLWLDPKIVTHTCHVTIEMFIFPCFQNIFSVLLSSQFSLIYLSCLTHNSSLCLSSSFYCTHASSLIVSMRVIGKFIAFWCYKPSGFVYIVCCPRSCRSCKFLHVRRFLFLLVSILTRFLGRWR